MYRLVKTLSSEINKKGSHYKNAWVINYTEDVVTRAYHNWYCKSVPAAQATANYKELKEDDRVSELYNAMIQIGKTGQDAAQKGETAVIAQLKSQALEKIPSGDELTAVCSDAVMSLSEWMDFIFVTPDICLEKEMQWPVDQDLIY